MAYRRKETIQHKKIEVSKMSTKVLSRDPFCTRKIMYESCIFHISYHMVYLDYFITYGTIVSFHTI